MQKVNLTPNEKGNIIAGKGKYYTVTCRFRVHYSIISATAIATVIFTAMKKIFFIFSIIITFVVSLLVFIKNLDGYYNNFPDLGDEVNYIAFSAESSKLISENGIAYLYKYTHKELISKAIFNIVDTPTTMFYLLGAKLYPKYKEDLFRLTDGKCWWEWSLSKEENLKRLTKIPEEMFRSARSLSLIAGVLSCVVLFLILWTLEIQAGALISTLLLIFNYVYQLYSVHVCPEIFLVLFSSLAVLFFLQFYGSFLDNRRGYFLFAFLTTIFVGIALITKLTAIIFVLYIVIFSLILIITKLNSNSQDKIGVLIAFICTLFLSIFITYYLLNPYIQLHPISGWLEMTKRRFFMMADQKVQFYMDACSFREKIILIPKRIILLTAPVSIVSSKYLFLLFGQNILFLIGMAKGIKSFKNINMDKHAGSSFILASLWIFMVLLLIIFLHCDWLRFYLLPIYFYFTIIGIGIGEIEKKLCGRLGFH